jgi:gliding motility-associated-like protein
MKSSLCTLFLAVGTLLSFNINAQINYDSLRGFDERAFINASVMRGMSGVMLKSELSIAKKEFIYNKYYQPNPNIAGAPSLPGVTTVQPSCTNMDFETGTFFGWDLSRGTVSNTQTMAGCCPMVGAPESAIINTGVTLTDPAVPGLNLTSPLGGTYIARVNNSATGSVVNRISQTFDVTTSNSAFQLAFAAVLNSVGNHCCNEQPNINITLLDSANNVLSCPFLSFSAPSGCCPNSDPLWISFGQGHYRDWTLKTIDLQRYIGTAITVQITVSDCNQSGHYGYAYFDMKCVPLEITTNGTPYNVATQDSAYISPCGSTSAIIGVPDGLGPYLWEGPPTSTVTGITTATIATMVPGTYTVTMSPPGACPYPGNPTGSIIKKAILRITPSPTATAMVGQPTCANASGTGQINVASGTGPFTFSWTPVASNGSSANGLTPGTSYTIIVTDSMGCKDTTSLTVDPFSDAPSFTITPLNGVLTCNTPSITLSALTATNTTGVWTNTTTSSINVTTPGTYTVVLTNTVSIGQCSTSVNVTVTGDTIRPTAIPVVSCNTTTIALNATSQPGVALGWLAPTLPTPSPVSNPGTSTAIGVYTLTATNLTTGCKRTYTVSTDIPNISVVTSPSTNSITCITPTVLATTTSTNGGVSVTWLSGAGTSTVNPYQIITPGTYTTIVTAPGGCTSQSLVTVTSNTLADVYVTSPTTIIPCYTNSLTLTANSSSPVPYTYSWVPGNPGFTGNPYTISTPGNYTVTAVNSVNGCVATTTYSVSKETVTAQFSANPTSGLMPLPVTLTNESINGDNYFWTLGNSNDIYTTTNAATTYDFQGTYTVTLIVTKGYCSDTASTNIIVDMVSFITIPNVFTPNGDGRNDIFSLHPINIGDISMTIFDRWGLKMYDTSSTGSLTWDGKTKGGADVADGTYFYIITAKGLDGKDFNFQGTVNIFR